MDALVLPAGPEVFPVARRLGRRRPRGPRHPAARRRGVRAAGAEPARPGRRPLGADRGRARVLPIAGDWNGTDLVTHDELRQIFGAVADDPKVVEGLPALNAAMSRAGISTPARKAAFLATLRNESAFRYDAVEAGNERPFRGRGFIQLTGEANYRAAGEFLGLDLTENPDLAINGLASPAIAAWYWTVARNINVSADAARHGRGQHRHRLRAEHPARHGALRRLPDRPPLLLGRRRARGRQLRAHARRPACSRSRRSCRTRSVRAPPPRRARRRCRRRRSRPTGLPPRCRRWPPPTPTPPPPPRPAGRPGRAGHDRTTVHGRAADRAADVDQPHAQPAAVERAPDHGDADDGARDVEPTDERDHDHRDADDDRVDHDHRASIPTARPRPRSTRPPRTERSARASASAPIPAGHTLRSVVSRAWRGGLRPGTRTPAS